MAAEKRTSLRCSIHSPICSSAGTCAPVTSKTHTWQGTPPALQHQQLTQCPGLPHAPPAQQWGLGGGSEERGSGCPWGFFLSRVRGPDVLPSSQLSSLRDEQLHPWSQGASRHDAATVPIPSPACSPLNPRAQPRLSATPFENTSRKNKVRIPPWGAPRRVPPLCPFRGARLSQEQPPHKRHPTDHESSTDRTGPGLEASRRTHTCCTEEWIY